MYQGSWAITNFCLQKLRCIFGFSICLFFFFNSHTQMLSFITCSTSLISLFVFSGLFPVVKTLMSFWIMFIRKSSDRRSHCTSTEREAIYLRIRKPRVYSQHNSCRRLRRPCKEENFSSTFCSFLWRLAAWGCILRWSKLPFYNDRDKLRYFRRTRCIFSIVTHWSISDQFLLSFHLLVFMQNFAVFGYARTKMTDEELRDMISKTLTCRIDKRCSILLNNLSYVIFNLTMLFFSCSLICGENLQCKLWWQDGPVLKKMLLPFGSVQLWGAFCRIGQEAKRERSKEHFEFLSGCFISTCCSMVNLSWYEFFSGMLSYQKA